MASAWFYRSVAADLDGLAAELDTCASSVLEPGRQELPEALDGGATSFLQSEYGAAAANVRSSAGTLRSAASWARGEAARIEAAEAAAAAAAAEAAAQAAAETETSAGEDGDDAPPSTLFY